MVANEIKSEKRLILASLASVLLAINEVVLLLEHPVILDVGLLLEVQVKPHVEALALVALYFEVLGPDVSLEDWL